MTESTSTIYPNEAFYQNVLDQVISYGVKIGIENRNDMANFILNTGVGIIGQFVNSVASNCDNYTPNDLLDEIIKCLRKLVYEPIH